MTESSNSSRKLPTRLDAGQMFSMMTKMNEDRTRILAGGVTKEEYAKEMGTLLGHEVSPSTVSYAAAKLGIVWPRKKSVSTGRHKGASKITSAQARAVLDGLAELYKKAGLKLPASLSSAPVDGFRATIKQAAVYANCFKELYLHHGLATPLPLQELATPQWQ